MATFQACQNRCLCKNCMAALPCKAEETLMNAAQESICTLIEGPSILYGRSTVLISPPSGKHTGNISISTIIMWLWVSGIWINIMVPGVQCRMGGCRSWPTWCWVVAGAGGGPEVGEDRLRVPAQLWSSPSTSPPQSPAPAVISVHRAMVPAQPPVPSTIREKASTIAFF